MYRKHSYPRNSKRQTGAALIAFMLVLIVGASYMLVSRLNINVDRREDIEESYLALERAKQALIGFAVTVPERSGAAPKPGPGYLPCPDIDNDGDAEGGCGGGGLGFSIGRIPYETLEEDVLVDDSGQVLWYVLADNYRNIGARFTPLNSDTNAGALTLDGLQAGNIVALIIAPGHAIANQATRDTNPNLAANYLEGDNSNGDTSFVSYIINDNPPTFNDRVIALTRQELMAAVEKRVLGEIELTLQNYRNSFAVGNQQAYPWLAPFTDPSLSNYLGQVGTSSGHLPIHNVGQVYTNQSQATTNWSTVDGVYTPVSGDPPDEACLRNTTCNDAPEIGSFTGPFTMDNMDCTWANVYNFNCTGSVTFTRNLCWPDAGIFTCLFQYQAFTRVYTYNINHSDDGTGLNFNPDNAAQPRTRDLDTNGFDAISNSFSLNVVDTLGPPLFICSLIQFFLDPLHLCPGAGVRGQATLVLNAADTADLDLTGVDFHLDANGIDLNADGLYTGAGEFAPDLPPWFVTNQWHHLTHIAYPVAEALPGSFNNLAPAAGPGVCNGNCLTLTANNGPAVINNNVRAIAVIAGQDLTPASPRPNANLNDYLDLNNSIPDQSFDKQLTNANFNDQSRVLLTTISQ